MEKSRESNSKSVYTFNTNSIKAKVPTRPKINHETPKSTKSLLNLTTSLSKTQVSALTPKDSPLTQSRTLKPDKGIQIKGIKKVSVKSPYETALLELKFPTTPSLIISQIPSIPEWAKKEMSSYQQVFYLSKQEKPEFMNANENDGDFKVITGDDIQYRYEIIEILGKGTFGQVVKVMDHVTKNLLAMKIIKNKQRYFDQSLIEVNILKFLQEKNVDLKANIVNLECSFIFRNHMVKDI